MGGYRPTTASRPLDANDSNAAGAVVQRTGYHVLKTRHHGSKPYPSFENGFRELQLIDLSCNNHRHLKTLENGGLGEDNVRSAHSQQRGPSG